MVTSDKAVADLLDCGRVDWVSLQEVVWYGTHGEVNDESKAVVLQVLKRLYSDGLMVPGDLVNSEFEDWNSPGSWLSRSWAELERFSWAPMGDGFWLRLTERGLAQAEGCS